MSTAFTQVTAVPLDGALPTQNTTTAGKALISNGTSAGWNSVLSMIGSGSGQTPSTTLANTLLPSQTGNAGKYLVTDGAGNLSWVVPTVAAAGVSSVTVNGSTFTGAVTITNVPSATTAGTLSSTLPVSLGGTGATSASAAVAALGAAPAAHTHNYAPTDSPVFTGNPTVPTAVAGDNDTTIANTAFVQNAVLLYAPKDSPVFTGNPTVPTAVAGDNDTSIANTAFVQNAIASSGAGLGYGQTWQVVARTNGTTYTNTTGKPIMVNAVGPGGNFTGASISVLIGASFVTIAQDNSGSSGYDSTVSAIIPNQTDYRLSGAAAVFELR